MATAGAILIVEDEADIRQMVGFALTRAGYPYKEAADADEAEACIREDPPDLILLDWMLPGTSGIDLARRLKRDPASRDIPIIMLTARAEESDKVRGFDVGVDDYITKPFSPKELLARIKAVLRRTAPERAQEVVELGSLRVDPETHRVIARGVPVELSAMEFRLLHFFITHPERVYSRNQLLDQVWGGNVYVEERTVDVHIRRLRKALAPHHLDKLIQTVRSVGYRFSTQH